jgi:hypothetical protein
VPAQSGDRPIAIQKKCACGRTAAIEGECDECRVARKPADGAGAASSDPHQVAEALGPGRRMEGGVLGRMEGAFGHSFGHVRLHTDDNGAGAAAEQRARAFTVGEHVAFADGEYRPGTIAGDALLAHELAHVVQQDEARVAATPLHKAEDSGAPLENEADAIALSAVASLWGHELGIVPEAKAGLRAKGPATRGQMSLSRCGADKKPEEKLMTHDEMVVERAKQMLPILYKYRDELVTRDNRGETRRRLLASRQKMEDPQLTAQGVEADETDRLARTNQRPVKIEYGDKKVTFRVRFHAEFSDPKHESEFGRLQAAVAEGAALVWHKESGAVLEDKEFEVIPEVTKVEAGAERDLDYWLISVRPTDESPPSHPGCTFEPEGEKTVAQTNPFCAGGLISLPPRMIGNSFVMGHEMGHLFGLRDRYLMVSQGDKIETGSRRELPAGKESALDNRKWKMLDEDVAFVLDRVGVYEIEENRGLTTLRQIEQRGGGGLPWVNHLIEKQELILKLGYDPERLYRGRTKFDDRHVRSGESLL